MEERRAKRDNWIAILNLTLIILLLVAGVGLSSKIRFDNSPYVYTPPNRPSMIFDRKLRERFPESEVGIAYFEHSDILEPGFLSALELVINDARRLPDIDKVISPLTQDHVKSTDDGFSIGPLIDVKAIATADRDELRKEILDDRFANRFTVTRDLKGLAVILVPKKSRGSMAQIATEEAFRASVKKHGLENNLKAMTGPMLVSVAQTRAMFDDMRILIPLTTLLGLAIIGWLFRDWVIVLLSALVLGAVTQIGNACYVLLDQPFNSISVLTPAMLSALTTALLIHLFNAIRSASLLRYEGKARIKVAMHEIRQPAFFCMLTTFAGFGSCYFNSIPPIQYFGLTSAVGIIVSYVICMVILPPILGVWGRRHWSKENSGLAWIDRMVNQISQFAIRRPALVLGTTVVTCLVALPQIGKVTAETNVLEFFSMDHPIVTSTTEIQRKLMGTNQIEVVFENAEPGSMKDPVLLKRMESLQKWLEDLPEVDKTQSVADFIKEMNVKFMQRREAVPTEGRHPSDHSSYDVIPANKNLISQYLLLNDGLDIYDLVDREFTTARVNMSINIHGANEIEKLITTIETYMKRQEWNGATWTISGFAKLFSDQEDDLVRGQINSLGSSLLLITILLAILWRSVFASLICLLPNVIPVALMFVAMGLFGIHLDIGTSIIASVSMGIAVDDTIHFYNGYLTRRRGRARTSWALARTYRGAGRAVVATTIILVAQYLLMASSSFQPTRFFGLISGLGIFGAMFFDLLFTPALLSATESLRHRRQK